jgi:hypothetical protein
VVQVQEWAEIRAMRSVEGLSIKEIASRTGHSRNTIRAALRSPEPPRYGPRASRPSKLDPFKAKIHELLGEDGAIPSQVIREGITEAGYRGFASQAGYRASKGVNSQLAQRGQVSTGLDMRGPPDRRFSGERMGQTTAMRGLSSQEMRRRPDDQRHVHGLFIRDGHSVEAMLALEPTILRPHSESANGGPGEGSYGCN